MTDSIEELFFREQECNRLDYRSDPEYLPLESLIEQRYSAVKAALGPDFAAELTALELRRYDMETLACFRHGFRLAVRLMLA